MATDPNNPSGNSNAATTALSSPSTTVSKLRLKSKSKKKDLTKKTYKKTKKRKKAKNFEPSFTSEELFTSREIGWLNFNFRVLSEAQDLQNPLLERSKFLAISSTNLDEFFMRRVGGLKRQIAYGLSPKSSDGQTPKKQLQMIAKSLTPMLNLQQEIYQKIRFEMQVHGCQIISFSQATAGDKKFLKNYFVSQIFPILTPLSVDPGHPFPFISNLSTSFGVSLQHPHSPDEKVFARLKIPKLIDQWIKIDGTPRIIHINEVVRAFIEDLFPAMKVTGTILFKVTRNADSDRENDDAEDLLATIEEELRQRRFAEVVRVEFGLHPDPWLKDVLIRELDLKEEDLSQLSCDFDLADIHILVQMLDWPKQKYQPWSPVVPHQLSETISIFDQIASHDIFLHHPFESFSESVERFISEASSDSAVLAIKMTLYRTGDNSPFIKSLIRAAEQGKQVVCLIELTARFDEERNIFWAQELENAGVHVVYGIVGFKTHAKTALVVRREYNKVKTYVHLGTGNYNVSTSRFYTDVGLLTANEKITSEVLEFFNYLTGKSLKTDYQYLMIAPINMFSRFKELILREADHAKNKRPSMMIGKFNNMEEVDVSMAMYEASKAGTIIQLIVRGFCCLKPGVKNLSSNIYVQSTLGRFLEHSRIFYFRNGQVDPVDGDFYIGSADLMYRNLHNRVEVITPILDRSIKEKVWELLQLYLKDQMQSWVMQSDGSYVRKSKINELVVPSVNGEPPKVLANGVQQELMDKAKQKVQLTEDDLIPVDSE
jgi:polyphosphate kinase